MHAGQYHPACLNDPMPCGWGVEEQIGGGRTDVREAQRHATRVEHDHARKVLARGGQRLVSHIPMNGAEPSLAGFEEHAVAPAAADHYIGVGVDARRRHEETAVAMWKAQRPGVDGIEDAPVAQPLHGNGPRLAAAGAAVPALIGRVQREQTHGHRRPAQFASASVNTRPSTSPSVKPSSAPIVGAMSRLRTCPILPPLLIPRPESTTGVNIFGCDGR